MKTLLFILLLASSAHAANLPSMCGDATNPTGCSKMPWGAIDFSLPDAPTPCSAGFFVAGISSAGALDCQLGGSGGTVDCTTAPDLICLGGRTGTDNDLTGSTDGDWTIHCSGVAGFSCHFSPDSGTPGFHLNRNGFGDTSVVIGPGSDPTTIFLAGGLLNFLSTAEGNGAGTYFGAGYWGDDGDGKPTFVAIRGRGVSAAATQTAANDPLFSLIVAGYDATDSFIPEGPFILSVKQSGASGVGYVATDVSFSTTDTTGVAAERIGLRGDGSVALPTNVALGAAVFFNGSIPTCGTGCDSLSATSNDRVMDITVSAGVVTSVTANFSTTLSSIPICTATSNSLTALPAITSVSTTAITIQTTATIGSGHLFAHCFEAS